MYYDLQMRLKIVPLNLQILKSTLTVLGIKIAQFLCKP